MQPLSLDRFGEPLHDFPAFTASVCDLRPHSRGRVEIRAADPGQAPSIQPNYLSDPRDLKVAADAIRLTRRIVAAPALSAYRPEEYKPGPDYQSEEDLQRAAAEIGTTIFHPAGTCRMGQGANAVVDAELRVHGIPGLRIADASIMPSLTSGNTCSPVLVIAEKAAQLILAEQQRQERPLELGATAGNREQRIGT
ncbi:Alcohol dehydrogenase [acceptor] [compost metagenome]